MRYGISREEEYELPAFKSHEEARTYFKEQYGENFIMINSSIVDGIEIYFYDLILNKEEYLKMQAKMRQSPIVLDMSGITEDMFFSSQRIEIFEDGRVHILH